jgi:hypothetical protein
MIQRVDRARRWNNPVTSTAPHSRPLWPKWLMVILFAFVAFECALWAVALKGKWFILLAPAAVCAFKAFDMWREIQRETKSDHTPR